MLDHGNQTHHDITMYFINSPQCTIIITYGNIPTTAVRFTLTWYNNYTEITYTSVYHICLNLQRQIIIGDDFFDHVLCCATK